MVAQTYDTPIGNKPVQLLRNKRGWGRPKGPPSDLRVRSPSPFRVNENTSLDSSSLDSNSLGASLRYVPRHSTAQPTCRNARHSSSRYGVATLELVLCMPIILALTVAIVWLGFAVVGQSKVAVEARHEAWKQRFDDGDGKALNFLSDDFATEDATTTVKISPLVNDISPPESSHDIAVGLWDHNKVEMNKAPNWEHYLTAAANAKTGGLQVAYTDARNQLGQLQSQAARAVVEEIQNTIREFLENPLGDFKNVGGGQQDEANRKAELEKSRLDQKIRTKRTEIDRVEAKIRELEQSDADKARIKIQRNKLKRLKAELELLRNDRKSLD